MDYACSIVLVSIPFISLSPCLYVFMLLHYTVLYYTILYFTHHLSIFNSIIKRHRQRTFTIVSGKYQTAQLASSFTGLDSTV